MFMIANIYVTKYGNTVADSPVFEMLWSSSQFLTKIDKFLGLKHVFLAGPRVGQVCFPFIVVVVEQGPYVSLLVFGLRIRGSHPILVCLLCNFRGNLDRNLFNPLQVWVQLTHSKVLLCDEISKALSRKQKDRLMDVSDSRSNHTKGSTGEDVGIVSLSRLKSFSKSFKGREWRSRRKDGFPLGECVRLLCSALRL